jgi:hypothetical protein
MKKIVYTCSCSRRGEADVLFRLARLWDEVVELICDGSIEEAGDVIFQISLLLHALAPAWVWLLPGAVRSQEKGVQRYAMTGCCRSSRNAAVHK